MTEGSYYILAGDLVFDQVNQDGDWESLSIFLSPWALIQPGASLRITKDIFEVFGNGNTWQTGEAAVLAKYPTVPEPASISLAILGGACLGIFAASSTQRQE